jgi:hypothetical protein
MTLSPSNLIVQGFWSGPLTTMERLSIASFLHHGHRFDLFTYNPREVQSIPPGNVHICDANEILPESEMATFRCAQQFSDFFRIALLLKRGGWHTDLDNVALKALDFTAPYVFYSDYDDSTISLALAKAPAGAPLLQHCYDYVSSLTLDERSRLSWQAIGAEFICGAVEYFKMTEFVQPGYVFDSIQHEHIRDLIDPVAEFDLSRAYSIHLFHAAWNDGPQDNTGEGFDLGKRRWGQRLDTDATFHPDCLYEKLKRRYDVSNNYAG